MKVRPVLASPLVLRVSTISETGLFSCIWILKTVEKTVTPHTRLTEEREGHVYGGAVWGDGVWGNAVWGT